MLSDKLQDAIKHHKLPSDFVYTIDHWYRPIANKISAKYKTHTPGSPLIVGVQGCQGSGKSTLADFLVTLLESEHQLNGIALSIDDFYLTKSERTQIAESIHPLLATRGVPGTHDVELAEKTIASLSSAKAGEACQIPRFNKAIDDRHEESEWDSVNKKIDIIVFEGWCVGLQAESPSKLATPINELESQEDSEAYWRTHVNSCLLQDYKRLFDLIDYLIVLKAPSFDCVYQWRLLQESKLIDKLESQGNHEQAKQAMTPEQIKRFISHYQRLTEHALQTLPSQADCALNLNSQHAITEMAFKSLEASTEN